MEVRGSSPRRPTTPRGVAQEVLGPSHSREGVAEADGQAVSKALPEIVAKKTLQELAVPWP